MQGEAEEDEWEDITQGGEDKSSGIETVEEARPMTSARGTPSKVISPGRPRGKGRRGYWVAKREVQIGGGQAKSGETQTQAIMGKGQRSKGMNPRRTGPETVKGAKPS